MSTSRTREKADKVTFTQAEVTSAVALKAPIASPTFTGDASFASMPKVGSVSIIESGSNSNGYYTKYSDGTVTAHKTVNFSGLSINPANGSSGSNLNANTTMAVGITDGRYTFGKIELSDSGGYDIYGNSYVADGNLSIFHSGLRPTNIWPRWDATGSHICTQGYYQIIAIGRWS